MSTFDEEKGNIPETVAEETPLAAEEMPAETISETPAEPVKEQAAEMSRTVGEIPEEAASEPAETAAEVPASDGKPLFGFMKNLKRDSKPKTKPSKNSQLIDDIAPAHGDTVITRSDEEAHRNVRYEIPGMLKQTWIAFDVELKRVARSPIFIGTFVLGIVMVILINLICRFDYLAQLVSFFSDPRLVRFAEVPTVYMATVLAFLPFFGVLYCSVCMSSTLPAEFKERTVYLHFALPVSKHSLYIGKFLANFVPIAVMIIVGYGFAFLAVMLDLGKDVSAGFVLRSLSISLLAAFALSSMVFSLSAGKKKGSTIKSLALLIGLVPVTLVIIAVLGSEVKVMESAAETLRTVIGYLPMGGFDVALFQLDSDGAILSPTIFGIGYSVDKANPLTAVGVYVAWGILFMLKGMHKLGRRQL